MKCRNDCKTSVEENDECYLISGNINISVEFFFLELIELGIIVKNGSILSKPWIFRDPREILARTSRNKEMIKSIPRGIGEWKKVGDLKRTGNSSHDPYFLYTYLKKYLVAQDQKELKQNYLLIRHTKFYYLTAVMVTQLNGGQFSSRDKWRKLALQKIYEVAQQLELDISANLKFPLYFLNKIRYLNQMF